MRLSSRIKEGYKTLNSEEEDCISRVATILTISRNKRNVAYCRSDSLCKNSCALARAEMSNGNYQTLMNEALKQIAQGVTLSDVVRETMREELHSHLVSVFLSPTSLKTKPGKVGSAFVGIWWANDKAVCTPYMT